MLAVAGAEVALAAEKNSLEYTRDKGSARSYQVGACMQALGE